MKGIDQRKDHYYLEEEKEELQREKIERAKERLRTGFYSSKEVILFLAEGLSTIK